MPTIIQNDQQMQALHDIETALGTIQNINTVTKADADTAELQVVLLQKNGRGIKVALGRQENNKIMSILAGQKQRLVKEITQKANRFRVDLNDADRRCMGDEEDAPPEAEAPIENTLDEREPDEGEPDDGFGEEEPDNTGDERPGHSGHYRP